MGWTIADMPPLDGKLALVTGSTDGLGREIAHGLARRGARVIVTGRNAVRGAAVASEIGGTFARLDLSDLAQLRGFADRARAAHPAIDILINNAGVSLIPDLTLTSDGFEMQTGINFLGHYALTAALLPLLVAGRARVVSVASIAAAHTKMEFDKLLPETGYSAGKAYGYSKLAMLMFAQELDRRARANGWPIVSIAAHPGVASSNLQNAGPSMGRAKRTMVTRIGNLLTDLIGQSTADGALPMLRAATDPAAAGGSYYGPDGWAGIKGSPVVVDPPKSAHDPADARRLWELAERVTGTRWIDA